MSTAPLGWQNPKTNWQGADVPLPSDFNRIEGNTNAIETGDRTVDQAQVPSSNSGTLRQFLDWFANRIKAITGTTNWYDAPATTLASAKAHIDATTGIHGATSSATANRLVARDGNGRAQFADPSAAQDAATRGWVEGQFPQRVVVLTGTIANGGTIPLPSGFTHQQCKFNVWLRHVSASTEGALNFFSAGCSVNETTRQVTISTSSVASASAAYMIIGVR